MLSLLRGRSPLAPSIKHGRLTPREVIHFGEHVVHVQRRAYKRSISLTLRVNGRIGVSAPKSTSLSRIEAFLSANGEWIETHLRRYQSLRASYPRKAYRQGERFLYLGRQIQLRFAHGSGTRLRFSIHGSELVAEIPSSSWSSFDVEIDHPELEEPVHDFYRQQGRSILQTRLVQLASRMDLWPTGLSFRSQKTRWGSCSAKGCISLNWRLIIAPQAIVDYVIVHELSHLRHYNHSRSFWALVASQVPDYAEKRQWLREHQYEADFLGRKSELHP